MKFSVKFAVVAAIAAVALVGRGESENVPDVLTAIRTRKSVRKFDPLRKVEDEKI